MSANAVLVAGLAMLVWRLGPDPATLVPALGHPQAYVDRVGADQAALTVVCGLCWIALAWLLLGLSLAAAGTAPGVLGRISRAAADRVLPAALRRTAAVAVGLSVATAGSATPALASDSHGSVAATASRTGSGSLDPDWPVSPTPPAKPTPTSAPAPRSPTTRTPPAQHAPDPSPPPTRPVHPPAARRPAGHTTATTAPSTAGRTVTVVAGQCLWSIAGDALGPSAGDAQIARAWPRWYRANRRVIGVDPDLIVPGQRLQPPA